MSDTERNIGEANMIDSKISAVVSSFAEEAKTLYGDKLSEVILYGSCVRGENTPDSDIDILLLLTVEPQEIGKERRKLFDISDELDRKYDVVLAPVLQSVEVYNKYMPVSVFYQNIQKEGVRIYKC
ncbi:MAG: nucleotidyltransferase domain-containing protein [Firmicutes bacterium]|nr:nucleotidyltransferase domain-containing protein [Bacillota bacterium]